MSVGFLSTSTDGGVSISDSFSGLFYYGIANRSNTFIRQRGNFTSSETVTSSIADIYAYDPNPLVGSCVYTYYTSCPSPILVAIEPTMIGKLYGVLAISKAIGHTITVIHSGITPNPPILHIYTSCKNAPVTIPSSHGLVVNSNTEEVTFDSRKNPLIIKDIKTVGLSNTAANGGNYLSTSFNNNKYAFNGTMYPNSFDFSTQNTITYTSTSVDSLSDTIFIHYSVGSAATYAQYTANGSLSFSDYTPYTYYYDECVSGYETIGDHTVWSNCVYTYQASCTVTCSSYYIYSGSSTSRYSTFYREGVGLFSNGKIGRGWISYAELKSYSNTFLLADSYSGCQSYCPSNVNIGTYFHNPDTTAYYYNGAAVSGLTSFNPSFDGVWEQFPYTTGTKNIGDVDIIIAKKPF